MIVPQDTTKVETQGLQPPRRSFRDALSRLLGRINPATGRVVARPSTARWAAPAVPPEVAARLATLQLELDAALAGGPHDLDALSTDVWTLTPIITTRDAIGLLDKLRRLQERRTAELNRVCDFIEIMQATNATRRVDDARYIAANAAQLGKGDPRGN